MIGLGSALGVWGVGIIGCLATGESPSLWRLVLAAAAAFLGVGLILITPPFGFAALLLPLLGALLAYYLPALRR